MNRRIVKPRKWPKYEIGRTDYIYTLGVLAANFNYLEQTLKLLFMTHVSLPRDAAAYLFVKLDNADRLKVLSSCFEDAPYKPRIKMDLRHFVKGFAICAENRNILLHSHAVSLVNATSRTMHTFFYKTSRKPPFGDNTYTPTLAQLRRIADNVHAFAVYGHSIVSFILRTYYAGAPKSIVPLPVSWPKNPPYQSLWFRYRLEFP